MRIVRPGETLPEHELRFFAKMAGRSYLHDPVHTYATRDAKKRETFVYHFIMERLHASNGTDYFYIDDAMRGICALDFYNAILYNNYNMRKNVLLEEKRCKVD